jgi:hypothetical protein
MVVVEVFSPDISWQFPAGRKWQFGGSHFSIRADDEKWEWRGRRQVSRTPFLTICGISPRLMQ